MTGDGTGRAVPVVRLPVTAYLRRDLASPPQAGPRARNRVRRATYATGGSARRVFMSDVPPTGEPSGMAVAEPIRRRAPC
ncbi:hypothetical protein GCM10010384_55430 [Streptomyces djakartensis]|uniref:Uncharacterized protein n=1 Tax=Streptomyces djakartensis TaxID=68193 RepID=A0ABQ3ACV1_9ACTN|nr:hypothetical protein GCM10010384_55430 [Streptomyces djakartensis]